MRDIGINLFTTDMPIKEYAKLIKSIGFNKILHDTATPEVIKANAEAVLGAGLSFDQLHAPFHTINNMCAIVFALKLGGSDFTKCISECVAIGLDNDCTGATVGSIAGACLGIGAVDPYWYDKFNDTVLTYIKDNTSLSIEDVVRRFVQLNK